VIVTATVEILALLITMSEETTEFETIRLEKESEKLGHIALNRPEEMNTFSVTMAEELENALKELEGDGSTCAVMISGEGRAFSVGADVGENSGDDAESAARSAVETSRDGQALFGRFRDSPLPIIAAIDGFALGAGMELTMCADLRVASDRAKFGLTEHGLGLLPGWGGSARLQKIVGESIAKYIIFTAERFGAEKMRDWEYVHEVYPSEEFDEEAKAFAQSIAEGPPIAQRYTKRIIHSAGESLDAGLELEASSLGHLMDTEDLAEGTQAFAEDRDPEFQGK
jgi:enoyl-CoA hydratase/3-hydroxyacyl-CoA dehydrogenase